MHKVPGYRIIKKIYDDLSSVVYSGYPDDNDNPVLIETLISKNPEIEDIDKLKNAPLQEPGLFDAAIQKSYYFVDTGLIAQNVYLAAVALGLVSWFHNCNKVELKKALSLKPNQRALFGQTVGYAKDTEQPY